MSKARTINDYYATVFLRRYHKDNPSKTGERTEIVVRIPEEAAKADRDVLKIALGNTSRLNPSRFSLVAPGYSNRRCGC